MKFLAIILLGLAGAAQSGAQPDDGIQRISWLEGCWELVSPNVTIEEQWMAPLGDSMVGLSRTVSADSLIGFETIVIREQGESLVYEAHPSGQASAVFSSKVVLDTVVIFENPEHDFPQRIGYRLSAPDSLVAWIEGIGAGEKRRVEFPYARASCPGD